jgi:hypothetical protein
MRRDNAAALIHVPKQLPQTADLMSFSSTLVKGVKQEGHRGMIELLFSPWIAGFTKYHDWVCSSKYRGFSIPPTLGTVEFSRRIGAAGPCPGKNKTAPV